MTTQASAQGCSGIGVGGPEQGTADCRLQGAGVVNCLASEGTDLAGGDFGHRDGPSVRGGEFDRVTAAVFRDVNDRLNFTHRARGREGQRPAPRPPPPLDGFALRSFGFEVNGRQPMAVRHVQRCAGLNWAR